MKLKTGTAFVIMIVLIIGSVLFGAYKGWSEEKAHVDATYAGLESMLQTRVETAYNILAVAKRHVPETDEAYQRVSMDLGQLDNAYSGLDRKAEANDALGRDAAARRPGPRRGGAAESAGSAGYREERQPGQNVCGQLSAPDALRERADDRRGHLQPGRGGIQRPHQPHLQRLPGQAHGHQARRSL